MNKIFWFHLGFSMKLLKFDFSIFMFWILHIRLKNSRHICFFVICYFSLSLRNVANESGKTFQNIFFHQKLGVKLQTMLSNIFFMRKPQTKTGREQKTTTQPYMRLTWLLLFILIKIIWFLLRISKCKHVKFNKHKISYNSTSYAIYPFKWMDMNILTMTFGKLDTSIGFIFKPCSIIYVRVKHSHNMTMNREDAFISIMTFEWEMITVNYEYILGSNYIGICNFSLLICPFWANNC